MKSNGTLYRFNFLGSFPKNGLCHLIYLLYASHFFRYAGCLLLTFVVSVVGGASLIRFSLIVVIALLFISLAPPCNGDVSLIFCFATVFFVKNEQNKCNNSQDATQQPTWNFECLMALLGKYLAQNFSAKQWSVGFLLSK